MNRQYYYLISLLPALVLGTKPPLSSEMFLQYCRAHLNPKDNEILQKITTDGPHHAPVNRFYDEWNRWDGALKKELGQVRAGRLSNQGESRSVQPRIDKATQEILQRISSARNPLGAEMLLARVRWHHLDGMEFGFYFDFEKIIAYALKLNIMERLESFEPVKGGIKFKEALDAIQRLAAPGVSASM